MTVSCPHREHRKPGPVLSRASWGLGWRSSPASSPCARPRWARSRPDFFKSHLFVWFAGALLVFGGLLIIAFHQYWSSVAAVMISLFGWILALRGVVLMAAPDLYERAAMSMGAISLVRLIFGTLIAIGLYLTYVGWLAKSASPSPKKNPQARS